jgi:hypothetical protein
MSKNTRDEPIITPADATMSERRFKPKKKPANWKPRRHSRARKGICCGAFSRRTGRECRNPPMLGSLRCRMHGGLRNSGPRTDAGRKAVSAALKRDWAAWRETMGLPPDWRYVQSRRRGGRQTARQWLEQNRRGSPT